MNAAGWIGFAPIVNKVLFAYNDGISDSQINYLSWIFMIMFVPMNFISVWVIENKRLRVAILMGTTIQTVGFWTRQLMENNFVYIPIGRHSLLLGNRLSTTCQLKSP